MSVIEVEHLSKAYGSTVAVDDISFSVEEGEIFGIRREDHDRRVHGGRAQTGLRVGPDPRP